MNLIDLIITKIRPPEYRLEGECRKCGTCCKLLYCLDDYTTTDFKITQFFYPKYKRFKIIGKDANGNIMLGCTWIKEDNTCAHYEKRLKLCKNFPNVRYGAMGKLPPGCGYRLVPIKKFRNIYENTKHQQAGFFPKLKTLVRSALSTGSIKH